MRDFTAVTAAGWILVSALACGGSDDPAGPGAGALDGESPSTAASAAPPGGSVLPEVAASAGRRPPAPGPSAPAPPEPAPPTMAWIRAEAEHDPAGFDGRPVGLDVLYVRISQRMYGYSSQHAGGTLPVLHVAFPGAPDDTMACQMNNHQWPPAGVKIGDTIHVEGVWSFDRLLEGGTVEGGGPLEIHACKVSKATAPGTTVQPPAGTSPTVPAGASPTSPPPAAPKPVAPKPAAPKPAAPKPAAPTSGW